MVPEDFEILIEVARALKSFMETHFLGVPKGKGFCLVTRLQKKRNRYLWKTKKKERIKQGRWNPSFL